MCLAHAIKNEPKPTLDAMEAYAIHDLWDTYKFCLRCGLSPIFIDNTNLTKIAVSLGTSIDIGRPNKLCIANLYHPTIYNLIKDIVDNFFASTSPDEHEVLRED